MISLKEQHASPGGSDRGMFKLLIDTCVWLDIAKDQSQGTVLDTLEMLLRDGRLILLLPQIVVDEFSRNKGRVVNESTRSLSNSLKRAKEAVYRLGEGRGKRAALDHLTLYSSSVRKNSSTKTYPGAIKSLPNI